MQLVQNLYVQLCEIPASLNILKEEDKLCNLCAAFQRQACELS